MGFSLLNIKDKLLTKTPLAKLLSKEDLAYKILPQLTLEIIRRYLRVESHGTDYIPKKGPAIIICNHSGYAGFDVMMLTNEIRRKRKRTAHAVAHKLWFMGKQIKVANKMGFIPADYKSCLKALKQGHILLLFPEGERGNFKPTHRRYHMQTFKHGFVRLAMETGAPIIPAHVIGAEETHLNLSQIKLTKHIFGIITPIPLNVIPLPVKWSIKFNPAKEIPFGPEHVSDEKLLREIAASYRRKVQRNINSDLRHREFVFLK